MSQCLKCGMNIDVDMPLCAHCGAKLNSTKVNFITYIGPENSLYGYQKSYKLVLLKCIIENIINNGEALVSNVIINIREFYLNRYNAGKLVDANIDKRIANITSASEYDVFAVMKSQPYRVMNEKGFLYLYRNRKNELEFTFHEDIFSFFDLSEYEAMLTLIHKKLDLYYKKLESTSTLFNPYPPISSAPEVLVQNNENQVSHGDKKPTNHIDIWQLPFLSIRAKNCLSRCGLTTLQLVSEFMEHNELTSIPNLGTGTQKEIETALSLAHNSKVERMESKTSIANESKVISVHSSLFNLAIGDLGHWGIPNKVVGQLLQSGYISLIELNGLNRESLQNILGKYKIDETFEKFSRFSVDVINFTASLLDGLREENLYQIYLERAAGAKLQQVAINHQIGSRERIRQIEKKMFCKLEPLAKLIFENLAGDCTHVSLDEVLEVFDDDEFDQIFVYTLKTCDEIEYLDFAELFVVADNQQPKTYDQLVSFAKDFVGNGRDFFESLPELELALEESKFSYISSDAILNLLLSCGAKFYGDCVFFGTQPYGLLCAKMVEEEFPDGIKIYDPTESGILRDLTLKKYGDIGVPDNTRALATRISSYLVLCDRGKYISAKNITIEISVVETIKSYIDSFDYAEVYYREIFNEFEGLLCMTSNVTNHNFLHGVLMYYYPEDYTYKRDHLIKSEFTNSASIADRLHAILIQAGAPLHRAILSERVGGYTDSMIFNAITPSIVMFQWEHNYYNCIENIDMTLDEKNILKNILEDILVETGGYCSDAMIYNASKTYLPDFINRNKMEKASNLFYVLASLFKGSYEFARPHICVHDLIDTITTKNIALHFLGNTQKIKFSEFLLLANKMQWPEVTSSSVFYEIEQDYMRISRDEYLEKSCFEIMPEQLAAIALAIDKKLTEDDILSMIDFDDFDEFPSLEYNWNPFLLVAIVSAYDFDVEIIQPKFKDRRYQKSIIVRKSDRVASLEDIVMEKMKQAGILEFSEKQFLSFLCINRLVSKVIPKELREGETLKFNDGTFSL